MARSLVSTCWRPGQRNRYPANRTAPMGVNYIVTNLTKRQYFDPDFVGGSENTKWHSILLGNSAHALAHLLTLDHQLGFHLTPWIGDRFFLVGDSDGSIVPKELVNLRKHEDESPWWTIKNSFADISLNLIAQMCTASDMLEDFLDGALRNNYTFVNLAHVFIYLDAPEIQSTFVARFGSDWRKRYNEVAKTIPWHSPRPMVPPSVPT